MIIGYNFFNDPDSTVFDTQYGMSTFNKTELSNGIYDEYYIDEDIEVDNSTDKPTSWAYTTVLNALFQNSLEGGSVTANGYTIESILLQRRKLEELYWENIQIIPYVSGEKTLYEAIDRYVQNDFTYEYSIVPLSVSVTGNRTISNEVKVEFEGNFLTDLVNNYRLIYDFELGGIQHNSPSATHEPLNSEFPIVTYSNTNYRSSSISCYIITDTSLNGKIDIKNEQIQRQRVMEFVKNKKPKILRLASGEIMLITIVDNPNEEPNNGIQGLSKINFSFVEVGNVDTSTLIENGLLEDSDTLSEVF